MTAYLRSDLWVKSCISQAEAYTRDPADFIRIRARFNFGRAIIAGATATVMYTVAIAILLVPFAIACISRRYVDICVCRKARQLFYLSTGRFQGALVATFVALISIFRTQFSAAARDYFHVRLEANWIKLKADVQNQFKLSVNTIIAKRTAAVSADELYCPYGAGTTPYAVMLAQDLDKRVAIHCNAFSLGTTIESKYERYEAACTEIDRYLTRRTHDLRELPLTYNEVGAWRVNEAVKLQRKALNFLTRQAADEEARRVADHPRKFDVRSYRKAVGNYGKQIRADFDARIAQVRREQAILAAVWDRTVKVHSKRHKQLSSQLMSLQNKEKSAVWWAETSSHFLPQFLVDYLQQRAQNIAADRQRVGAELGGVNAHRVAGVKSAANGSFLSLNSCFFDVERTFNRMVDADGKILRQVEYLATPVWYTRLWRGVSPVFSPVPSWQQRLENWLDPDM